MLKPLKIIIEGTHDMGKTTVAHLIQRVLEENDFSDVKIQDGPPLPEYQKDRFMGRLARNRDRPIRIEVRLLDTATPVVVNVHTSEYDVDIRRPGKWGNPFHVTRDTSREQAIAQYEQWIKQQPDLLAALPELGGKRLGCVDAPDLCHGDVLVRLYNELVR